MTNEEYRELIEKVGLFASLVEGWPVAEALDELNRLDTLAPILDPTAWMRHGSRNIDEAKELLRPLLSFQSTVKRLKKKAIEEGRVPAVDAG